MVIYGGFFDRLYFFLFDKAYMVFGRCRISGDEIYGSKSESIRETIYIFFYFGSNLYFFVNIRPYIDQVNTSPYEY